MATKRYDPTTTDFNGRYARWVAALESGADTISVSGVVIVSGALAAAETGSDTMQTTTGEGYPSSVTITVPASRLLSAASGRTITLRPR